MNKFRKHFKKQQVVNTCMQNEKHKIIKGLGNENEKLISYKQVVVVSYTSKYPHLKLILICTPHTCISTHSHVQTSHTHSAKAKKKTKTITPVRVVLSPYCRYHSSYNKWEKRSIVGKAWRMVIIFSGKKGQMSYFPLF